MRRSFLMQVVLVGGVALGALLLTAAPAHAGIFDWFFNYNDTQKNSEETVQAVVDGEEGKANKKHFDDGTLQNVQSSAINYILGPSDRSVANLSTEQKRLVYARYGQGGAIGAVTDGIVALYTPPASVQTYVADLMHSAHIIPKAQAQGLGFASLDPILEIWKVFRNLAYLVFVILFIVIGFMIMFRQKIGQTAVTVQQAIPNIIVSLIFVTFSYAIAGFMIDLMYVLMYLLVGMFSSEAKAYEVMQYSFIDVGLAVLSNSGGTGAFKAVMDNVQDIVSVAVNMDGIGAAIGWVAGLTAAVIMAVAILISVFKLFFELLKTYITIVLSIAFAPMILMMGALPGRNAFQTWIVNLAGNLLAFPTVLLSIIVFRMFANAGETIDAGGFLPPFLIGRGVSGTITTLVGVGIVLIMPELVVEMKKAVGVKGGIFEQLGKAMISNWSKGEVGLPLIGGAAGGIAGGAYGGGSYLNDLRKGKNFREQFNWRDLGRAMKKGHDTTDSEGNPIKRGGAAGERGWASRGYNAGQSIRRTIDRARENRLLDAEDPAKMFSAFMKKSDKNEKPPKPEEVIDAG